MRRKIAVWGLAFMVCCGSALAADYRLEPLPDAIAAEELSPAIAKTLQPEGVKVIKGKSRTLCDIWLCAEWAAKSGFKPTNTVLYPFEVGQLVGVARYKSKGTDFRGQEIPAGVYTIRYAQQPVDGNHVGTSDTLDFLLLLPADFDKDIKPLEAKAMFKTSAKVVGTKHPTMLALRSPSGGDDKATTLRNDEANDLWIVRAVGKTKGGEQTLEFVVAGEGKH